MNNQPFLISTTPQFTVLDIVQTAQYYRDVLGFRIRGYWKNPPFFAIVARDNVDLFFNQATHGTLPHTGHRPDGYDVSLKVTGLEALAAQCRANGANIIEGPVEREYGIRELVLQDCNGLIPAFGETAPPCSA